MIRESLIVEVDTRANEKRALSATIAQLNTDLGLKVANLESVSESLANALGIDSKHLVPNNGKKKKCFFALIIIIFRYTPLGLKEKLVRENSETRSEVIHLQAHVARLEKSHHEIVVDREKERAERQRLKDELERAKSEVS